MNSTTILQAADLTKIYGSGETEVRALDGVNLAVREGEFVAIVGTSGSGKSTLLNMLGGLDTPTSGEVTIADTPLSTLSDEQLTVFRRRRIGFIFQNYNLIPTLNVWENIVFPITLDGQKPDREFILEIVRLLGLEEKLDSLPNNLSGGQQQRVAIARAPARWQRSRRSFSPTSQPATSIPKPATMSSASCIPPASAFTRPSS